jgi:protein TonB
VPASRPGLTLLESAHRVPVRRLIGDVAFGAGVHALAAVVAALGGLALSALGDGPVPASAPGVVERVFYLAPAEDPEIVPLALPSFGTGEGGRVAEAAPAARAEAAGLGHAEPESAVAQAPAEASASEPYFAWSELDVDSTAVRDPASAAPVYPPALLAANVEGSALVQFVVDSTGRPDPASFRAISATDSLFAAAVRDALPRMKFRPAWAGGQRVAQLVEQNFAFRIAAATAARRP